MASGSNLSRDAVSGSCTAIVNVEETPGSNFARSSDMSSPCAETQKFRENPHKNKADTRPVLYNDHKSSSDVRATRDAVQSRNHPRSGSSTCHHRQSPSLQLDIHAERIIADWLGLSSDDDSESFARHGSRHLTAPGRAAEMAPSTTPPGRTSVTPEALPRPPKSRGPLSARRAPGGTQFPKSLSAANAVSDSEQAACRPSAASEISDGEDDLIRYIAEFKGAGRYRSRTAGRSGTPSYTSDSSAASDTGSMSSYKGHRTTRAATGLHRGSAHAASTARGQRSMSSSGRQLPLASSHSRSMNLRHSQSDYSLPAHSETAEWRQPGRHASEEGEAERGYKKVSTLMKGLIEQWSRE